jgi:hypothetical protein
MILLNGVLIASASVADKCTCILSYRCRRAFKLILSLTHSLTHLLSTDPVIRVS